VQRRRRAVAAAAALLLGVAFCFVMYWWQLRYRYAFHGLTDNLFLAIPFAGLAVMILGGMTRIAAAVSWLVLAGLTGVAYVAAATSSSSTASIVFVVPFVWGGIVVCVIFAVDSTIRSRARKRRSSELPG
jgi:biotin transporter BioY